MAKRYYNLEKETKAFLKRMEETRGVLPDSAGIARINDYIVKRKGLGLILGTRNKVSQVFTGINQQKIQTSSGAVLRLTPSWEMVTWLFPSSVLNQRELIVKGNNSTLNYEYSLKQNGINCVLGSANSAGTIINTPNKLLVANTWQFVRFGRDELTTNLFVSRNNDTPVTTAQATQTTGGAGNTFSIGDWSEVGQPRPGVSNVDSTGRWNRVLTVAEYTFLYNSGLGVSFYEILGYQPSLLSGLVSYWQLNESGGIRYDWWGTNHLTPTSNVLATTGIIDKFF
jgi:hypothetical protein